MSDPNILNLLSEETYIEKMDTLNEIMEGILIAQGGSIKPTSWSDVQQLVRFGLHKKVFSIGDQLTCEKDGVTLTFDVIGIDHDTPADPQFTHSMTLCLHNIFQGVQFDQKEAFYAASIGLAAGTYNITIGEHPWVAAAVGKTYQFTLTHALPENGQIVFNNAYNAAFSTVSSYATGADTTAIETVSVTEGNDGTNLGTINNAGNPSNGINSIQRALLGSNNYKESAIRQWLNSNKAAGSVWTQMTKFDRLPDWNSTLKGWMNGLDADFLAVVGKTTINTARNTVSDGGGYDTTKDKFFLLSRENVYAGKENSIDEGGAYPYYSNYSDHGSASTGADTNRIKYSGSSASWWWLRSPSSGYAYSPRYVNHDGVVTISNAMSAIGAVPACNII